MKFRFIRIIVTLSVLFAFSQVEGQIVWQTAIGSAWLNSNSWTGGALPGSTDIVQFDSLPTSATIGVGIKFDSVSGTTLEIGSILMSNYRNNNLIIGNSSSVTSGTLNLNGNSIGSISNVKVANLSGTTSKLTIQNTQSSGNKSMLLNLGSGGTIVAQRGTSSAVGSGIDLNCEVAATGGISFNGGGTVNGWLDTGVNGGIIYLSDTNSFNGGISVGNADGSGSGVLQLSNAYAILNSSGNDINIHRNSQLLMAGPTGCTYYLPSQSLHLAGNGNTVTSTGNGALVNKTNGNYSWGSPIVLDEDASIYCNGSSSTFMNLMNNVSGSGKLVFGGVGTIYLGGSTHSYTGGTFVNGGHVQVNTPTGLPFGDLSMAAPTGTASITLSSSVQNVRSLYTITDTSATGTITIGLGTTQLYINQDTNTVFGSGSSRQNTYINGIGSLYKAGTGRLSLATTALTLPGGFNIAAGELNLCPKNGSSSTLGGADTLSGGNLTTTGTKARQSFNMGTLVVANDATIDLGTDSTHSLKFSNSSSMTWTTGKTLTIRHWVGLYNGTAGTVGRIFFGTNASGLTTAQLAQISFIDTSGNVYQAKLLSNGELVPLAPTLTTTSALYGPYCNNVANTISVSYTAVGPFTDTFKVQISNASGVFPTDFTTGIIGSGLTSPITAVIPSGMAAGTAYRVRVINARPTATFGTNNGSNISIIGYPVVPAISVAPIIGVNASFVASNGVSGGVWSVTDTTVASVNASGILKGLRTGVDTIIYQVTNTCSLSTTVQAPFSVAQGPAITSINPTTAIPGTSLTISGSRFNSSTSGNVVLFGDVRATVTAASATSLTVTVPSAASLGQVVILDTFTKLMATSAQVFKPAYDTTGLMADSVYFKNATTFAASGTPVGLTSGDLDGDGKPDMVVVNSGPNNIYIYLNNATGHTIGGSSYAAPLILSTGLGPHYAVISDLDNDGKQDIVVTSSVAAGKISVFRNTSTPGTLSFATRVDYSTGGANPFDVAIADLDFDGKADIAVTNQGSDKVGILKNQSTPGVLNASSFANAVNYTTGSNPTKLTITDLNNDAKPDIAVVCFGSNVVNIFKNTTNQGIINSGSFSTGTSLTSGNSPFGIASGDVDGDGFSDLAITDIADNDVMVFRNISTTGSAITCSSGIRFAAGTYPSDVIFTDVNADKRLDIAATNYTENQVTFLLNNAASGSISTSSFNHKTAISCGDAPGAIVAVDVDIDNKTDIAVTNQTSGNFTALKNYPLPYNSAVSGPDSVCLGTNPTLTNTTTGGTWQSTNSHLATVSGTGNVTTLNGGLDTISYYTVAQGDTNFSIHPLMVDVYTPTTPIYSSTGSNSVCLGAVLLLADSVTGGRWTIASGGRGSINASGVFTGTSTGSAIVTYTVSNTCGTTSDTFNVNINPSSGYSIGRISGTRNICRGGINMYCDTSFGGVWSIGNSAIATVSHSSFDSCELVTGLSYGTTTLTYSFSGSCGVYLDTISVNVDTSVILDSISGSSYLCEGTSTTFRNRVSGNWSGTTGRLTITSAGVATGVSQGADTVVFTTSNACGSFSISKPVFVIGLPHAGTITGPTTVCPGDTIQLIDTNVGGLWTVSNSRAISLGLGKIKGVTTGLDTIRYVMANVCGVDTAKYTIQVTSKPIVGAITGPTTLCVGGTAIVSDTTAGGVWAFTNASAIISDSVITGVSTGTDTLVYAVTNVCGTTYTTKVITVVQGRSVGAITGPAIVCVGGKITLSDTTTSGTWSVTNRNASITTTGVLTGLIAGLDTVKFTTTGTCPGIATHEVNIQPAPATGTIIMPSIVCVGDTIVLKDSVTGGTWVTTGRYSSLTDSNLAITALGTDTVYYTVTAACGSVTISKKFTSTMPPKQDTITGPDKLYVGEIVYYQTTNRGGTWTTSGNDIIVTGSGKLGALVEGTDTLFYTNSNSCGTTIAYLPITISATQSADAIKSMTLTPNPNQGIFKLRMEANLDESITVLVYDVTFRVMSLTTMKTNEDNNLDCSDLQSGVYFVSAITRHGWTNVKFVVAK